jgi:hypothetical protein
LLALRSGLGLHARAAHDFFDALIAHGLLLRDDRGRYSNSEETDRFLDTIRSPSRNMLWSIVDRLAVLLLPSVR